MWLQLETVALIQDVCGTAGRTGHVVQNVFGVFTGQFFVDVASGNTVVAGDVLENFFLRARIHGSVAGFVPGRIHPEVY